MKSSAKTIGTALLILSLFFAGAFIFDNWMQTEGRRALKTELQQASIHCYAVEGRYPPSLDYLRQHYGIRTNNRRYTVEYHRVAPNRAPEISVKSNKGGAWA